MPDGVLISITFSISRDLSVDKVRLNGFRVKMNLSTKDTKITKENWQANLHFVSFVDEFGYQPFFSICRHTRSMASRRSGVALARCSIMYSRAANPMISKSCSQMRRTKGSASSNLVA